MSTRSPEPNSSKEVTSWIITIAALTMFWPLGLILLFRKISKSSSGKQKRENFEQPGTQGLRDDAASTRSAAKREKYFKKQGKGFVIGGSIMAGVFGISVMSVIGDAIRCISWGGNPMFYLDIIFPQLGFFGAGLVLLFVGLSRNKRAKRFRKYLALIGRQKHISVETVARAMPVSMHTACDDLQEMLDEGILPQGFLDMSTGMLNLGSGGIHDVPKPKPEPKPEPQPAKEPEMTENDRILEQIRLINDAIADEEMSRKIDRIEEITRRIFVYQKKNPEKSGELRSFLNYYLPTTLKILTSYAQMEEQGVEGRNISAAKESIEGMMDKVVEGFEKQLDKLFEGTAMDITTDVQVLERMLEKDGLSGDGQGLTLGG